MLEGMEPPPKRVYVCKFAEIREALSPTDQQILDDAMNNTEEWATEPLVRELKRRGLDIGRETLRLHRRALCACVEK